MNQLLMSGQKSTAWRQLLKSKEYKALADQVHLQIQALIDVRPNLTKATILVPCTMHWLSALFI